MKIAVVYWIDDDFESDYVRMCYDSILSLRKYDKKIPIKILGPKKFPIPYERLGIEYEFCKNTLNQNKEKFLSRTGRYSIFNFDFKDYDLILYVDCDTLFSGPVRDIFRKYGAYDFSARLDTPNESGIYAARKIFKKNFKDNKWRLDINREIELIQPFFNTGVFLFHPKIGKILYRMCKRYLPKRIESPHHLYNLKTGQKIEWLDKSVIENMNFARAIKSSKISYGFMDRRDHGFYWEGDTFKTSTILHFSFLYPILRRKLFWRQRI